MPDQQIPIVNSAIRRGCGYRVEHALYACVPTGAEGVEIESFILDPPLPWGQGHFRGPRLYERQDGVTDMILWIGQEHYPYVSDFIEEARQHGISRRVPITRELTYSMLTHRDSRILLVHPRAIYNGTYRLRQTIGVDEPEILAPRTLRKDRMDMTGAPNARDCDHPLCRTKSDTYCAFAGWDLSANDSVKGVHEVVDHEGYKRVVTPSVEYLVRPTVSVEGTDKDWRPGIFAAFPLSHFEYVNSEGGLSTRAATTLGRNTAITAVTYK
tara:strand:+ start:261 stop:1067 length:807 start_codon:yes stop_codon:yes gene_type:complete